MRLAIIGGVVLLAAALFITFAANTKPAATPAISIATVQSDISTGGQLLDVRTPEEFSAGFIEGAVNVPLGDLQAGEKPSVATEKNVYVYCRSGNRSAQAKAILEKAGYTNVTDLGGINDVVAIGGNQIK